MGKFNKATAAVLAGALTSIIAAFVVEMDANLTAAIQTVVTAILVWFVPNKE